MNSRVSLVHWAAKPRKIMAALIKTQRRGLYIYKQNKRTENKKQTHDENGKLPQTLKEIAQIGILRCNKNQHRNAC